jgi:predicted dinucleotide-binding enzyme
MKIAVLGAGNIGGTMGKKWAAAGHEVVFGVRDATSPKVTALLKDISGNGRVDSVANALAFGDVVLVAIPYDAVAATVAAHADRLAGKVVIDASNKFGAPVVNNLETIRQAVPTAQLFRAFNALGWEIFANPQFGEVQVDHFYCGPDGENRQSVEQLIAEVGVRPVWVGGLEAAPVVDALGTLWVTLAFRQGWGRGIAFKIVER